MPFLKSYTLEYKIKVINHFKSQRNYRITSKEFNIPRCYRWIKKTDMIVNAYSSKTKHKLKMHPGRCPILGHDVENQIHDWFISMRKRGCIVLNSHLIDKAFELSNTAQFKASSNWLFRFKWRYLIVTRKITAKRVYSPYNFEETATKFKNYHTKIIEDNNISASNILNADETSICFDMPTNYTLETKGASDVEIKTSNRNKQCVTLMLAIKSDGTRLPPLIIFKEPKGVIGPRVIKTIDPRGMVVVASKTGWMNSALFNVWCSSVIAPAIADEKHCLFLDRFSAHTSGIAKDHLREYDNLEIVYIPSGCTSKLQPLDHTIFKTLKAIIKSNWITKMHGQSENQDNKVNHRQNIIDLIHKSIQLIKPALIQKSFVNTGILLASQL